MPVRPEKGNVATLSRGPLEWGAEDLDAGNRRFSLEWLETDGLGGFACGCPEGASARAYHGWYAPPGPASRRRAPLVSGCEEYIWCEGETSLLWRETDAGSSGEQKGRRLVRFALEPFPTWRYETERFAIERTLCLVRGRPIASFAEARSVAEIARILYTYLKSGP